MVFCAFCFYLAQIVRLVSFACFLLCLVCVLHWPLMSPQLLCMEQLPPPPICIALILLFRAPFCLLSSCSFFFCLFDSMHFLLLFSRLCFVARSVAVVWLLMWLSLVFLFTSLKLTQIAICDHLKPSLACCVPFWMTPCPTMYLGKFPGHSGREIMYSCPCVSFPVCFSRSPRPMHPYAPMRTHTHPPKTITNHTYSSPEHMSCLCPFFYLSIGSI